MNEIIAKLFQDTGIRTIPANTTAPTPPLPYAVYNITAPYNDGPGHADTRIYHEDGKQRMKVVQEYSMTVSFTIYAKSTNETIALAKEIRSWFAVHSYNFISEKNLVVSSVGNIQDRTAFLVDSYEYKYGFDVELRGTDVQVIGKYLQDPEGDSVEFDWIEKVELKFKGVKH